MAEEKIVGFQIEISGQKEIVDTTKLMGLLNTQLILVAGSLAEVYKNAGATDKQLKEFGTSAEKTGKAIKGSFKTFEKGNKTVKDLGNGYLEVKKSVKKAAAEFKDIEKVKDSDNKSTADLIKRNKVLKKVLAEAPRAGTKAYKEQKESIIKLTKEYSKNNDEIKKFRKELRTGTKVIDAQKGSLDELRSRAIKLKKEYNKLGTEQRKTFEGKRIQKELRKTQQRIQKLDLAVRDGKTSIGLYGNATKKLGKTLLTLSVGRDIIRGLFQGLANVVEQNKETNKNAKSVSDSFEKLKNVATKFGLAIINFVAKPLKAFVNIAGGVSKALFGIDFEAAKASEAVIDLKNGFNAEIEVLKRGNISTEARKQLIEDINKKYKDYLPNLLTENSTLEDIEKAQNGANKAFEKKILLLASEEQFIDITKRRLDALREQIKFEAEATKSRKESIRINEASALTLESSDTRLHEGALNRAADARSAANTAKLALSANKEKLELIEKEKAALDLVIKTEGIKTEDFLSSAQKKTKAEEAAAAAIDRTEKRAAAIEEIKKKRAAAEKKRIADRLKLIEELEKKSLARLSIIIDLANELQALEIQAIKDGTEKAIAEEKNSFEQRTKARRKSFDDLLNEEVQQQGRLLALFEFGSAEYIEFSKKSESDVQQILQSYNKLIEEDEKQHLEKLQKIRQSAADIALQEEKEFFDETEEELIEGEKAITAALKKARADRKTDEEEEEEKKKEKIRQTTTAVIDAVNTTVQAIADISALAFAAENERFEQAIQSRKNNISKLNEDLQTATGLQKKFLLQQVKQEEEALQKETENKEKAQRKQAETQKAISIIQAIIAGALGIANAFSLVPPASFIAAAATAVLTGVQIATIASQKFAEGGILSGPAHSSGGIQTAFGELEGGEAVINKKSTKLFRPILSALNRAGGGRSFAEGGILGAPISAPLSISSGASINDNFNQFLQATTETTAAINNRIDKITVVQDLNNLQDIQDNDNTLNTLTTF